VPCRGGKGGGGGGGKGGGQSAGSKRSRSPERTRGAKKKKGGEAEVTTRERRRDAVCGHRDVAGQDGLLLGRPSRPKRKRSSPVCRLIVTPPCVWN
jgi:hypothetical protein